MKTIIISLLSLLFLASDMPETAFDKLAMFVSLNIVKVLSAIVLVIGILVMASARFPKKENS